MEGLNHAVSSTLIATTILTVVFGALWAAERERFFGLWAASWAAYCLRLVAMLVMLAQGSTPWLLLFNQLCALLNGLLLLWGTQELLRRPTSRAWLAVGGMTGLWVVIGATGLLPFDEQHRFLWASTPVFLVIGAATIWAGVTMLRHYPVRSTWTRLAGWALLLWGLHKFNYPWLRPIEWFAPWGYALATALGLTVALAIMLAYFELSREESRRAERRFRQLFEHTADAVILHDFDGSIIDANRRASLMLGYEHEEFCELSVFDLDFKLRDEIREQVHEKLLAGEDVAVETTCRDRSGQPFPVEAKMSLFEHEGGSLIQAQIQDITARRWYEDELSRELSVTAALTDISQALIGPLESIEQVSQLVLNGARRLTGAEQGFVASIDPETKDMVSHTLTAMVEEGCELRGDDQRVRFSPDPDGRYPGLWGHALETGQPFLTNSPDDHPAASGLPQGHITLESFLMVPVLWGPTVVGAIALANSSDGFVERDLEAVLRLGELYALAIQQLRSLEERAELERQLNHAEKMKAVGQLAGGIAHDFNNLLQGILGYTQFALQGLDEQHPVHADLLEVSNAAERAADLTSQMLAYSRRETVKRRHLDLDGLLDKSLKLLQRMLGEKVVLTSGRPSGATIFADPGQLEQVLVNLTINARDAMPEGGEIQVETEVVTLTEPQQREHPELRTARFVRLSVADEGVGISQEQLNHIFEPFFSTKEVGQGTGLGLATVYAIIEQHKGFLEVDSTPGRGTTFHTYLPLSDSPPDAPQPQPQPQQPQPGHGLLLLVEDEDIVRDLNAMVLRQAGYDVIEARDGVEGIALAQKHKEEIRLAVLDVVMPRKGGVEVFNELRAEDTEMPVIFSSGYSYSETETLPIDQPRCLLLRKPYAPDDLLRAISTVLAPQAAPKKTSS